MEIPFEETYKRYIDRGYGKEFLEGYNSKSNDRCPYKHSGYQRLAWIEGHNCRTEEIEHNIMKKNVDFSNKTNEGSKKMKVNFARVSKADMQAFITKFNKDVEKRKDLKKQLKELSKQPRKNKSEIEAINTKLDRLNAKIDKNKATMKEYLEKVGAGAKKTTDTKKKVAKVVKSKKPVKVSATELKVDDIIVDPFKDGNNLKIVDLFVAPDTVWVEFDNGEKLGYAIDKKTKANVLR